MQQIKMGVSVLISMLWGLTACGVHPVKSSQPLDLRSTGALEIAIHADHPRLQIEAIRQQAGKSLADWAFPIAPPASLPVSHTLTITIGTPEHGGTPAGFSFTMGNSDPRALDFQKADVVPISCRINGLNQPEPSAELNMGFSDSAVIGTNPDVKAMADHVSTVCFNLLKEVKWPVKSKPDAAKSGATSWMPEIRIEQEAADAETASKAVTHAPAEQVPNAEPATQEHPEEKSRPVTKEITKEGRKVYIIHNQGNPITFKFGHERK